MQNDYNNKQGQTQTLDKDKINDFARSAINQGEDKIKDIAGDAQKKLKQVQEQAGQVMSTVEKQVRENPWPILTGVAIGFFLLGSLFGKSKN